MRSPSRLRPRSYVKASLSKVQGSNHGELANTPDGRVRIAAAAERLDRTVVELGNQYRGDIPKGEKSEVVQHQQEPEVFSEVRLSLSSLRLLGQFENLHMSPGGASSR